MYLKHLGLTHVKCTKFRLVESAEVTSWGLAGDRAFMVVDEKGKLLSSGAHGRFLPLEFTYDSDRQVLRMRYPDGRVIEDACPLGDESLELDMLGIRTERVRVVGGIWNDVLRAVSGRKVTLLRAERQGGGIDVLPLTLLTTASLQDLAGRMGEAIDHRVFRCNLILEHETPYIEDVWNGRLLRIGNVILRVRSSVPRCVVTQLDPDTGRNTRRTVAHLGAYRNRTALPDGLMPGYATPGFCSYAEIIQPGSLHLNMTAELLDAVG